MKYAIGVGSNRGDRHAIIAEAARRLSPDMRLWAAARLRETAPVGGPSGMAPFLNGAWVIETGLGPHQLLQRLQVIETALGRVRVVRWGPRTLDLDLLLREDGLRVSTSVLTVPHPLLAQRRFVLEPLAEIAGQWRISGTPWTVNEALARL